MGARSSLVPAMASGTATVFKLLVATLAFAGAYFGVAATHSAAAPEQGAGSPVRTVVLSGRSLPVEATQIPQAGMISVGAGETRGSCERTYHVQSVIDPGSSGDAVMYGWRLLRWAPRAHAWKTYLSSGSNGFIGRQRAVEWHPRIVNNPGWYRAELEVSGKGVVVSERFQVSC